ncbi:unnamed protein product [Adineta steineri]|uniref:Nuclear receptor domain-containing protein n=2 Tax=Adineta steineri TaxID=433720 RepID=A0A814INA5_9BILA|nr:unnamed protein product [Adineta steineri]CAF4011508.1 unnamed protein product [Adineta steineri]
MDNENKMIILTSNEDLINQLSANKIPDTHTINFNYLNNLSQLNSKIDKLYEKLIDSSVKNSNKFNDRICVICGNVAIGYNYDVLTCASCRIFFYRNQNQRNKLKCLLRQGQCSVDYKHDRKCPRCRLDRCFQVGMRKDLRINHQQKQNISSKSLSQPTHTTDNLMMDIVKEDDIILICDNKNELLSAEDLLIIENIRSSFVLIFQDHNIQCSCVDISNRICALVSWSQFASRNILDSIKFFRKINQFEQLNIDDRFILIKYNIFLLFLILKCFYFKRSNDCCSYDNNQFAEKHRQFFILCGDSYGIRDMFVNLIHSLVKITEQDPIFLSFLLIILLLSQGLSMNENEPSLKDSLIVNQFQSYYIELLWKYLINKQGEIKTWKCFTHLITIIIRIQSVGKIIREFFRIQSITSDVMDQIEPLMHTLLLIQ